MIEKPNFGALLEIRPQVIRGSKSVIVDLKSTITVPGHRAANRGNDLNPAPVPPLVDRIAIETQELATTLRIPLGQPVLVGGLTYVPPSLGAASASQTQPGEPGNEAAAEHRQLYFVLEIR